MRGKSRNCSCPSLGALPVSVPASSSSLSLPYPTSASTSSSSIFHFSYCSASLIKNHCAEDYVGPKQDSCDLQQSIPPLGPPDFGGSFDQDCFGEAQFWGFSGQEETLRTPADQESRLLSLLPTQHERQPDLQQQVPPSRPPTPRPPPTPTPFQSQAKENIACTVRFVNTTSRLVDVIELDPTGTEVVCRSLSPESTLTFTTTEKQFWIFRDSVTRQRLYIKKPKAKGSFFECQDFLSSLIQTNQYSENYYNNLSNGVSIICVLIDRSVESLRHLALQTLRQSLKTKDDCFCLQVPQAIQFELSRLSC